MRASTAIALETRIELRTVPLVEHLLDEIRATG
jgi:hypothetical protein